MPTVARVVYPNGHRPAHVHAIGGGCEAVFNLNRPHGPPELRENFGFPIAQVAKIKTALADELQLLCVKWIKIHESY
jgi:hypothetical protein